MPFIPQDKEIHKKLETLAQEIELLKKENDKYKTLFQKLDTAALVLRGVEVNSQSYSDFIVLDKNEVADELFGINGQKSGEHYLSDFISSQFYQWGKNIAQVRLSGRSTKFPYNDPTTETLYICIIYPIEHEEHEYFVSIVPRILKTSVQFQTNNSSQFYWLNISSEFNIPACFIDQNLYLHSFNNRFVNLFDTFDFEKNKKISLSDLTGINEPELNKFKEESFVLAPGKEFSISQKISGRQYKIRLFPVSFNELLVLVIENKEDELCDEENIRFSTHLINYYNIVPFSVIIFDCKEHCLFANENFKLETSLSCNDISNFSELISYTNIPIESASKKDIFQYHQENETVVFKFTNAPEKTFELELFENNNYFFGLILRNITEQLNAQNMLTKSKEEAEKANLRKTSFLVNMSHELRTPMNCILGFTHLLNDDSILSEDREKYTSIIDKNGKQLITLINDIIDLSKIEAGQIKIFEKECILNELLFDIAESFKQTGNKKNIDIIVSCQLSVAKSVIITDEVRLKQILSNLISNALKFTKKGYVRFGYSIRRDSFIEFFVQDTGIGIDKDKQKFIFDRFSQLDVKDTSKFRGTGLGLEISKAFIELLGGRIWLHSLKGVGSTFYFTLPYYRGEIEEPEKEPEIYRDYVTSDFTDKKILIVEDEHSNYLYLHKIIEPTGASFFWAENGNEALNLLKESNNFDIILLDIGMPDMDGFEFLAHVKELNVNIPIVAQTAFAMMEDKEKLLSHGCNAYLAKPIDPEDLMETLANFLRN